MREKIVLLFSLIFGGIIILKKKIVTLMREEFQKK